MAQEGAFGSVIGATFRVERPPALVSRTLQKSLLAVTHVRRDYASAEPTAPIPKEDAILFIVTRRDILQHELWLSGKHVDCAPFARGTTALYDLRRDPVAIIQGKVDGLTFYLPRSALDEFTDDLGATRLSHLAFQHGVAYDDPIMTGLATSVFSAIEHPDEASSLFVDHMALAFRAHVAHRYGDLQVRPDRVRGGLAPWQQRRAEDLLTAKIASDIALAEVARECGLSLSCFTRAFKSTTGLPPHRWLLRRRVERAKELLRSSELQLAEIALTCGFADQSHLTRVFQALAGCTPGVWRRRHRD